MMKKVSVLKKVEVSVSIEKLVPATVGFFWGFYKDQYQPYHVIGCPELGYCVDTGALKIPVEDIEWYGPVAVPNFPEATMKEGLIEEVKESLFNSLWHQDTIVVK